LEGGGNICMAAEFEGKVVGTTVAMNYGNRVVWIGMVLVDSEYRGMGISRQLLEQTLEQLQQCNSIKLDATPAGQPVYKKIGFKDEYLIHRITRVPMKVNLHQDKNQLIPLSEYHIKDAIAIDSEVFGANRESLVNGLIANSPGLSWIYKKDEAVVGFVTGRPGSNYMQVGPLAVPDLGSAKELVSAALMNLDDQPVVMDVPAVHEEFLEWLESVGFVRQRIFTRMYLGENMYPGVPEKQWLICGPEFG
jgi:predicted GNAT family acetyltransferase